ncbi:MAG: hypothetical protein KKD38_05025 [Candidatus Delongbacteria bacterium]|nr:hypothetical protein [Candidatus Delongbacteria bacterium]MCG2759579.1 hypothetical protein [Candidatus Delongbacteria bacterium]
MKIKISLFLILILGFYRLSYCDSVSVVNEDTKSISTNVLSFGSYWLDNSMPWYDLYRDPSLPDSFRIIFQDVCDHVEPSSVIGQYYSFNYTDIESERLMYDNICQIKYADYGDRFAAKCCTTASPEAESPNYMYAGTTLEFDILINSNSNYYVWTTGNFNTTGLWDKEHTLRHEVAHGINLRHNDFSELMRSDENNDDNPQRSITDIDRYNYNALYNPVTITKPAKPSEGFLEKLLVHGGEINIEASKPSVVQTEYADIDFYLLNEDLTYYYRLDNFIEFNKTVAQKYAYDWVIDTLKVKNKAYNLRAIYSGFPIVSFETCEANIKQFPHDELKIRFSELTFDSPQKNQRYSVSTPLNFKVYGKSALANVDISEIANIATVTYKLEEDNLVGSNVFVTETNVSTNFELTANLANYDIDAVDYLVTVTVKDELGSVLAEIVKMPIKLYIPVDLVAPAPGGIYNVRSRDKGAVTDTLAIKVSVPEVFGSYPAINIKIDGTYVNQGSIIFDSVNNVWVYYWVLATVNPTELGKRYNITAEIDGDPTSNDVTGVYLVEAIFNEDFQVITDLTAAGWTVTHYQSPPPQTSLGWVRGPEPGNFPNKGAKTYSTNSTSFTYQLWSPAFTIPDDPNIETRLEYKLYYSRTNSPESYLYYDVCNVAGTPLTTTQMLGPINGGWTNIVYDLSSFAGQTIKLHWNHLYTKGITGFPYSTTYLVDNVLVYSIPDMECPNIDFIAGNTADIDEDMNLNIGFNDNSGISSVTANYTIDGSSGSLTLYPVKGSFNYTGTIPAKDHECAGSISFKITDSVGNETVSGGHAITWAIGGGVLAAPVNVVIAKPTSTTISITWDIVDGATGYKVYSSTDPYGTFTEDTTGTFTESRKWEKTIAGNKYFYYVVAVNAVKKEEFLFEEADISDR